MWIMNGLRTHTAELREVFFWSLVLLVLIDPLVEVGLQELDFLRFLEKTRPVLVVELLLAQLELNIASGMVDLTLGGVDLSIEGKI